LPGWVTRRSALPAGRPAGADLHSALGELGYTRVDGPHPFGTPVALPEPFDLELETSGF